MKRRSPIKHPVKSHERGGVKVHRYERGKGSKPSKPSTPAARRGRDYSMTAYFSRGQESYSVGAVTYTEALRAGLTRLQIPEIPERVILRRLST